MYSIYFFLRFTLFIEKQTRLLKTYISGKVNCCYVIYLLDEGRMRKKHLVGFGKTTISKVVRQICQAISGFAGGIYLKLTGKLGHFSPQGNDGNEFSFLLIFICDNDMITTVTMKKICHLFLFSFYYLSHFIPKYFCPYKTLFGPDSTMYILVTTIVITSTIL